MLTSQEASGENNPSNLNLDFQPPELREDQFLLLNHLICGPFILKPNQINTPVFSPSRTGDHYKPL